MRRSLLALALLLAAAPAALAGGGPETTLVVGSAGFSFASGKSRVLPGAILEHLTSFGAHFGTADQTKLTEFLRYGAAGSSGTVMEPLSIHLKFPNPLIHAFYAEGLSLAEAFYASVGGPFQLMVVGDGLARPFASLPTVVVHAPAPPWKGVVEISPSAQACEFELWLDGRLLERGETFRLDTTLLDDGWHDCRVVAVTKDRIETRATRHVECVVVNDGLIGAVKWEEKQPPFSGGTAVLRAEGTKEMEVLCQGRVVGATKDGKCALSLSAIGSGPVALVPRLVFGDGKALRLLPVSLTLTEPAAIPALLPEAPRRPGLLAAIEAGGATTAACVGLLPDEAAGPKLEKQAGAAKADRIVLQGEVEAPSEGMWQLDLTGNGTVTVEIGGRTVLADADLARMQFAAADLPAGWHPVRITLVPAGAPRLFAALAGGKVHGPASFRHRSRPLLDKQPSIEGAEAGKPILAGTNGVVLAWKSGPKDLAAIVLTPAPNAEGFPGKWIVEVPAGRDKWKEAEGVTALVGPPAGKAPAFLELSFGKPLKPTRLRVRPAEGAATLTKIEALGRSR